MRIEVLDHGFVEFIEAWGHGKGGREEYGSAAVVMDYEVGIIEAARQSTQGAFRGWDPAPCNCFPLEQTFGEPPHSENCASQLNPGDRKLLNFLYGHKHFTPFEFSGMVLEVQAPIFVFREWHRHRTQSYNEMSARYAPLPDLHYRPAVTRCVVKPSANKQAQGTGELIANPDDVEAWLNDVSGYYARGEKLYRRGLGLGLPKEIARIVHPVGHYSKMRASANLRNWLAFLTLRLDPAAQWEIRQYAEAVAEIIETKFPQTYRYFAGGG
jgi:thymidylate synthase (FAD)